MTTRRTGTGKAERARAARARTPGARPAQRDASTRPASTKSAARPRKTTGANQASASPAKQLEAFLAKYTPEIARSAREVLPVMRARFPGAQELVYDNYNALAIGWSPTGKTSDVICSIALFPRWISLFFFRGAALADPEQRLQGSGSQVRHVVLERGAATLREPAVDDLIRRAIVAAPVLPTGTRDPEIVIKSISAKQRPRRPA